MKIRYTGSELELCPWVSLLSDIEFWGRAPERSTTRSGQQIQVSLLENSFSLASGRRDLEECSNTIPQSIPRDSVRASAGSPDPACTRGASRDRRTVLRSCLVAQKHKNTFRVSSAGWTLEMHLSAGTEWPHQYQRTKQTRRAKEGLKASVGTRGHRVRPDCPCHIHPHTGISSCLLT